MSFRNRLAAKAAILAVAALLAGPSAAADAQLRYVSKPVSDPEVARMWADVVPTAQPLGEYAPWATVARVRFDGSRELVVSQFWSSSECGVRDCPIRVFENDEMVATFKACSEDGTHVISDDARLLTACDTVHLTNRR